MSEPTFTVSRLAALTRLDRRRVAMLLAGAPVAKAKGTVRHYALGDSLPLVCLKTEDAEAVSRMAEAAEKLKALDLQKRQLDQMKKLHTRPINGKIRLPAR